MAQLKNFVFLAVLITTSAVVAFPDSARAGDFEPFLPVKPHQFAYIGFHQMLHSRVAGPRFIANLNKERTSYPQVEKLLNAFGMDLTTDIDYIAAATSNSVDEGVFIMGGHFNPDKFGEGMQILIDARHDIETIKDAGRTFYKFRYQTISIYLTAFDARHVIFGTSLEEVKLSMQRAAYPEKNIIEEGGFKATLAGIGDHTALVIYSDVLANAGAPNPGLARLMDKAKYVTVGVAVDDSIKFDWSIFMANADTAKELKPAVSDLVNQMLVPLLGLAIASEPKLKPLTSVAKSIAVSTEGNKIVLSADISQGALDAILDFAKSKMQAGAK